MRPETVSYLMLFFAILVARNERTSLTDSLKLVPLSGGAKILAAALSPPSTS